MNYFGKKSILAITLSLCALFWIFPVTVPGKEGVKQVVFIRYNLKDQTGHKSSDIVTSFKETMEERGYVEGEDIEYIDIVTHSSERDSAAEIIEAMEQYKESADMFITTSWTSLYVRSKLAKSGIPQLFVPALRSSALNMLPTLSQEPGTNLSGIYLMYQPEKILRLTRHVLPGIKKYAYVYDSSIQADIMFKSAYGQLNDHERYGIMVYYLDLAAGTDTVLQKMNKMGIDAFGGVIGVFTNLADLSRSKLPIITALLSDRSEEKLIKEIKDTNILAGLYNPFSYCASQAAEMTADIFEGKNTIEKTVPRPARQHAFINLAAANRLGINIPFSVLEGVDIVIK